MFYTYDISLPCFTYTIYAYPFFVVFGKFPKTLDERPVFLPEAQISVFDLICCNITVTVANILIMFIDLSPDIIQMAIDAVGLDAAAFDFAAADLP